MFENQIHFIGPRQESKISIHSYFVSSSIWKAFLFIALSCTNIKLCRQNIYLDNNVHFTTFNRGCELFCKTCNAFDFTSLASQARGDLICLRVLSCVYFSVFGRIWQCEMTF